MQLSFLEVLLALCLTLASAMTRVNISSPLSGKITRIMVQQRGEVRVGTQLFEVELEVGTYTHRLRSQQGVSPYDRFVLVDVLKGEGADIGTADTVLVLERID